MSENIVEQISRIEAEADRLLAEARQRCKELEGRIGEDLKALRVAHQKAFDERLSALKTQLREQTAARLQEIEAKAREAARRLEALDPELVRQAGELILNHLRGDGRWQ